MSSDPSIPLPQGSHQVSPEPHGPATKKFQKTGSEKQRSGAGAATGRRAQANTTTQMATKITQATAVVGMQGSINRLTDIMERSFLPEEPTADPGVERLTRAVKSVEKDEGLTVEERAALISVFMANPTSINIYLSLTDPNVRQAWIARVLNVG
jgi:hypothetical protein